MATKIHNPNEKSRGFIYAVVALLVIILLVIGVIVFNGRKHELNKIAEDAQDAAITVTVDDNVIRLASDATKDSTPQVDLYEDYSCPHCAELAEATDDDMLAAIEKGSLVVNVHSLNFLDRDEVGHSTLAGAAARSIAETGDGKAYWNFRRHLYDNLNKTYTWKAGDFAEAAKAYGASGDVVKSIEHGDNVDAYKKGASKSEDQLKKAIGKVSSPHILKDGKDIEVSRDWVAKVSK